MTTQNERSLTWLDMLLRAAKDLQVSLPRVLNNAMGTIAWKSENSFRQVTLRHSLRRGGASSSTSVIWGFWESDDLKPNALIRENIQPDEQLAATYVSLIRRWLCDNTTIEDFRGELDGRSVAEGIEEVSHSTNDVLWLGPEQEFGFEVRIDGWRILSGYNVLSVRRKIDGVSAAAKDSGTAPR